MQVSMWYVVAGMLVSCVTTYLWLRGSRPFFSDWGHRCYDLLGQRAAFVVLRVVEGLDPRLKEKFTFRVGSTVQTLLGDGTTVLIQHSEGTTRSQVWVPNAPLSPNGFSVVVKNPLQEAEWAAECLRSWGFEAEIRTGVVPELGDKLVAVASNAFTGWVLILRLHVLKLGKPPGMCKLADLNAASTLV